MSLPDPIQPLTPDQEAAAKDAAAHESPVIKDLVGLDIFVDELAGGQMDESISSRMARWDTEDTGVKQEVGKIMSEGLDLFQKDHGAKAEAGDLERAEEAEKKEESTGDLPNP